MLAFALSVASSVSWGFADFMGGQQTRRMHVLVVVLAAQVVGLTLSLALMPVLASGGLPAGEMAAATLGGMAGACGQIAFYEGMARGPISVVSPLAALGVVVPIGAGLARGEEPATVQLIGVAAAVIAIVIISYEEGEQENIGHEPVSAASRLAPVLFGLAAGLGFGLFFLGVDAAAEHDTIWTMAAVRIGGCAVVIAGILAVRPSMAVPGGAALPLIAIGAFDFFANVLYAVATIDGLLPLVAAGASLYPAVTILLAYIVVGERLSKVRQAGVALALTGCILIAAGS